MPILNFNVETKNSEGFTVPAPEVLRNSGPIIPVTITMQQAAQNALQKNGRNIPKPVNGFALIDTGATVSCFDLDAAKQAGLPNAGVAYTNSATHKNQKVPTFSGTIICPNINMDINEAMGLPLSG